MLGYRIESDRIPPASSWGHLFAVHRPIEWIEGRPVIVERLGKAPVRAQAALDAIADGAGTAEEIREKIGGELVAVRVLLEGMDRRGLVLRKMVNRHGDPDAPLNRYNSTYRYSIAL